MQSLMIYFKSYNKSSVVYKQFDSLGLVHSGYKQLAHMNGRFNWPRL